jgi:hypothetical protein
MIFAKNSDRSPNEPHIIERHPARDIDIVKEPKVKATYIEVDQVKHTYAVTLFRPSWIWGAEMGFNEYGVQIGNEAVFTKQKRGPDALTGMDMLRLALERSKTAYEAFQCITELLSKYGQGGNCGYQKKFFYDNSFLIADKSEAYVLETAGIYWAGKKVKDYYAISNGLTLEKDFDYAHEKVLSDREKDSDYSFRVRYAEPLYTMFAQSKGRRAMNTCALQKATEGGKLTAGKVMEILRGHAYDIDGRNSVGSVCMHAGGLIGDQTTGAYIAVLGYGYEYYYATGASLPCMSVFKPMLSYAIDGDCSGGGIEYWAEREKLTRYFLAGMGDSEAFKARRDALERDTIERIENIKNRKDMAEIVKEATAAEAALIEEFLQPLRDKPYTFTLGKGSYKKYWTKKTEKLLDDLRGIR